MDLDEKVLEYLSNIENVDNRAVFQRVLDWVQQEFPELKLEYKWNAPMFTLSGTFIIGFHASKNHFSVASEFMYDFLPDLDKNHYSYGKKLFRIAYQGEVNYSLLADIIRFGIEHKQGCTTFWKK